MNSHTWIWLLQNNECFVDVDESGYIIHFPTQIPRILSRCLTLKTSRCQGSGDEYRAMIGRYELEWLI
jgi:hypothetical protein